MQFATSVSVNGALLLHNSIAPCWSWIGAPGQLAPIVVFAGFDSISPHKGAQSRCQHSQQSHHCSAPHFRPTVSPHRTRIGIIHLEATDVSGASFQQPRGLSGTSSPCWLDISRAASPALAMAHRAPAAPANSSSAQQEKRNQHCWQCCH